jgi:hypothetical protein
MAFVITNTNSELLITNGSVLPPARISLPNPVIEMALDYIAIYDNFGKWERKFHFIDFGTIAGVAPSSLEDAYAKLLVLQVAINAASGGGALPAGAATSANQVTLIEQGTGVIDTTFSTPALPYTVPAGVNSFSIITQGSVAIDGITVPSGTPISASHPSQDGTVLSPAFTDVAAGSLFVTLGIKV